MLQGWSGKYGVNTNSANIQLIMTARIRISEEKGYDGVAPADAYANDNGLRLKQANAVDHRKFLANVAHFRGISVGLKNAGAIVGKALAIMEWHVSDQCVQIG